jgi:hypothetical protein
MKMESIVLQLSEPNMNKTEINQIIEVSEEENYHSALGRSLKKAQDDFNSLLSNIIDEDKKRLKGTMGDREAKKMKKQPF